MYIVIDRGNGDDLDACVVDGSCSQVHCGKHVDLQHTGGSSEAKGEKAL